MASTSSYEKIWDLLVQTHRATHGADHVPKRDFNCCGEYGLIMALRACSSLRPDYPGHLIERIEAPPPLDQDFYVKNVLATDGEPEPADPEALREYRAARRYHVLWGELKAAAARIEALEVEVRRLRSESAPAAP